MGTCRRYTERGKGNVPCQTEKTRNNTSRLSRDYQEGLLEAVLKQVVETLVKKVVKKAAAGPEMTVEAFLLQIRLLTLLFALILMLIVRCGMAVRFH